MELFGNDKNKIILGDVIQILESQVSDASVNLIFADPPYNIGKNFNGHKDKWKDDGSYLEWSHKSSHL